MESPEDEVNLCLCVQNKWKDRRKDMDEQIFQVEIELILREKQALINVDLTIRKIISLH